MPDNDRTTDHRHGRPDSDRREGGSVRDLRVRRESNRQSVMGRLTVPGVARQQEPPAARNTVTIRDPDQMSLPGLRPVDDHDQQQPSATPTSLNGSPSDPHASPAIGAAAPVTLAPPPTEIGEPLRSHDGAADRESSGPEPTARRAHNDLRRPPPARERDHVARIVTATGSLPRRPALLGLAVLVAAVAAVVVATTVLNPSSGSGARGHTSTHSTTIQTASFGGQDPRATERLKPPLPTLHAQGLEKLGADAAKAAAFVKRRPHRTATSPADTSSALTDTTPEQPTETSTYEPAKTSSTPSYSTTTPAPTQTTPAPNSSSGGSSNGGGSSSTSSSSKTPDYGPMGELGPGSSPDG